jgi:hypothetical protein
MSYRLSSRFGITDGCDKMITREDFLPISKLDLRRNIEQLDFVFISGDLR